MAWALGFLKSLHVILIAAKLENYNSLGFDSGYDTILLGSLKKIPSLSLTPQDSNIINPGSGMGMLKVPLVILMCSSY